MEALLSLITALGLTSATAVVTHFVTRSKIRFELMIEYDKKLRAERLDSYKLLWKELKPLARYSEEDDLTYEIIRQMSEKMRDWYFDDGGGIYLSKRSREPYFKLKKLMEKIIDDETLQSKKDEPLKINMKNILEQGSALRESLSDDIGTRRESFT